MGIVDFYRHEPETVEAKRLRLRKIEADIDTAKAHIKTFVWKRDSLQQEWVKLSDEIRKGE